MMKQILALVVVVLLRVNAQSQRGGNTDESRPYKFAFNIEGYQHRSEEKDEKGIVKGEYGFVTGDGVYHVTVYATDENGNFKILSMKNFFIGLPTNGPSTSPPQTTPRPTTVSRKTITNSQTLKSTTPSFRTTLGGIMGCGGCQIPTSTSTPDLNSHLDYDIDIRSKDDKENPPSLSSVLLQSPMRNITTTRKNIFQPEKPLKPSTKTTTPQGLTTALTQSSTPKFVSVNGQSLKDSKPSKLSMKRKEKDSSNTKTNKLIKNTNTNLQDQAKIVMSKPSFQAESDDKQNSAVKTSSNLLYEFNQTQSFQGQFEQGFVDSSKTGNYFVNDRNGIRRVVEYEANENGFQPHVKFEKITGSDVPIPETEKNNNVLKQNYFKWFYGS